MDENMWKEYSTLKTRLETLENRIKDMHETVLWLVDRVMDLFNQLAFIEYCGTMKDEEKDKDNSGHA